MGPAGGDRNLQTISMGSSLQQLQFGVGGETLPNGLIPNRFRTPDPTQQRMPPLDHIGVHRHHLTLL
tara:strand:- start:3155 stop:3355 length:201 start_codon:yes stop_codon:yes gene_type:complete